MSSATIARQVTVQFPGGVKFCKKKSKGDVRNLFWPRKIWHVTVVPFAYFFLARNLGKNWLVATVVAEFTRGGGILIQTCMHANSDTHAY